MDYKYVDEKWLSPAVVIFNASGRERNPCSLCGEKVIEGEKIVETATGSYKNKWSYDRYHYSCFLKPLAMIFHELLFDNILIKRMKKEIVLRELER